MNKFFSTSLTILGGIFLILLLIAAGFWASTSMQSKSTGATIVVPSNTVDTNDTATTDSNTEGTPFVLTEGQKSALSSFGIDPASVPSTISTAQEACFTAELGENRVEEIKGGATPTAIDFFKVKGCL